MKARFDHRVAWIVAAALGGVAACTGGSDNGASGGKAGGRDGGGAAAECLGPTWFGGLDTTARSKLVGMVCVDARSGSLAAGRLDSGAGPSCKSAYSVRSDDAIESILTAVDDGEAGEANVAETSATAPAVRDFAHTLGIAHTRSSEQGKARLARRKGRAEDTEVSRDITAGFKASDAVLHGESGPGLDDEFLARVIVQHARELEMLDDLAPKAKDDGTRCAIEKARTMALSHLQLACVVSSQTSTAPPAMTRPRVGQIASGASACDEKSPACKEQESPPVTQAPPVTVGEPPEAPATSVPPPQEQVPAATVEPPNPPVQEVTPVEPPKAPVQQVTPGESLKPPVHQVGPRLYPGLVCPP